MYLFFADFNFSVDLQEVCEEGQSDPDKMHIPMVSPTGVQCKSLKYTNYILTSTGFSRLSQNGSIEINIVQSIIIFHDYLLKF